MIESTPLMEFKSHIAGKNARVSIYPDRVEWHYVSWTGMSKSTNTLFTRRITGITTHKGGWQYTNVQILAGDSTVTFRVTKAQASEVRDVLTRLTREA